MELIAWAGTTQSCRIVGVLDGDTVDCLTAGNQQIRVRLAQIDAPEKAQPFGQVSKRALSDLVYGQTVTLEAEGLDQYGRTIGDLKLNGKDINLEMVRTGNAWVYERYAKSRDYFAAQDMAKSRRIGLWQDPNPIPPSEWRRARKQ